MIEFNESMNFSKFTKMNPNDKNWDILEKMYNKNFLNYNGKKENKIPKIIHQVWLGSEYPKKFEILNQYWKNINPDWEFKIWTDDDVETFGLKNIDLFKKVKNFGTKSDIFRYEILHRYGGIYIDTDFYCVKSFNDLLFLDFFAGTGHQYNLEVFNGLIGCKPENKIIKNIIDVLGKKKIDESNYDSIISFSGPVFLQK